MPSPGDERLADWLDGRMTPRELERFEAEMRVSKPLREKAEAYRKTALAVKDAFSVGGPKIDLADAVLARIADPQGGRPGVVGGGAGPGAAASSGIGPVGGRVLAFPKSLPSAWILSSLVACAMIALGVDAAEALASITQARGLSVPDTDQQREWVMAFGTIDKR